MPRGALRGGPLGGKLYRKSQEFSTRAQVRERISEEGTRRRQGGTKVFFFGIHVGTPCRGTSVTQRPSSSPLLRRRTPGPLGSLALSQHGRAGSSGSQPTRARRVLWLTLGSGGKGTSRDPVIIILVAIWTPIWTFFWYPVPT